MIINQFIFIKEGHFWSESLFVSLATIHLFQQNKYVWRIDVSLHQILRMSGTSWISVECPYFRAQMKTVQACYGSRFIFWQNTQFGARPLVSHLVGRNAQQLILFVVCSIMILNTPRCHQLDSQNSNLCYLGLKFNTSFPNMWHKTPSSSVHDKHYCVTCIVK